MRGAFWDLPVNEQRRLAKEFRDGMRERHEAIAHRNANAVVTPWPKPRFLSLELEVIVAREISERPLHGVPSVFRAEAQSVTNIMLEQLRRDAIALAVPRSRPATFLSPADQRALKAKIADPATSPAALREYRSRLSLHRPYRGG